MHGDQGLAGQDRDSGSGAAGDTGAARGTPDPAWVESPADRAAAAHFFARTIGADARYISHGEIQSGLSIDGKSWVPNLDALFVEDMADPGPDRGVLLLRDGDGAIVAAAILLWTVTDRVRFAIIEDMAVDPAARSQGIGARMVEAIEAEAARREMRWIFLESGVANLGAHGFFERHGFGLTSHTFAKQL